MEDRRCDRDYVRTATLSLLRHHDGADGTETHAAGGSHELLRRVRGTRDWTCAVRSRFRGDYFVGSEKIESVRSTMPSTGWRPVVRSRHRQRLIHESLLLLDVNRVASRGRTC